MKKLIGPGQRFFIATTMALAVLAGFPSAGPAAEHGSALFESRAITVDAPVLSSFLQDLNNDGRLDFAFLAEDRRFVILLQKQDGRFRTAEAKFTPPKGIDSLDLADVDGDGVPDICFTVGDGRLRVIRSAGTPEFWEEIAAAGVIDQAGALTYDLTAAGPEFCSAEPLIPAPLTDSLHRSPDLMWDLDGDGRQDIFYPRFDGLETHLNRAAGGGPAGEPFSAAIRQFFPRGPQVSLRGRRIEVRRDMPQPTDLDGDGVPEVVFEPRPVHGLGQLECGWCRYSKEDDRLHWVNHSLQFGIGESVTEYLIDDINGDGMPDLAVLSTAFDMEDFGRSQGTAGGGGSFFEEKKLRVYLSGATGGGMKRLPAGEWTSEINLWQEAVIRCRDLTNDGEDDLCLFYYKGLIKAKLVVDIYPGIGRGRFGPRLKGQKLSFDSADRQTILVDSDLDGDGLEDLLLLAEDRVQIFRRDTAGRHGGEAPYSPKPWAVLETQLDAESGGGEETVTLRLGTSGSDISFNSNKLQGVRVADLNGDGLADLVIVNRPADWNEKDLGRPPLSLTLHLSRPR